MLRIAATCGVVFVLCGLLGGGIGCNDDPPTESYAVNLGTPEAPLLPVAPALLAARDPRIMSNAQAELVKRGDTEAAAAARTDAPATATVNVNLEPASSLSEALGNIGRTFVSNLSAKPAGPAEAAEETTNGDTPATTNGETQTTTNGEAPATTNGTSAGGEVTLNDTDVQALNALVAAISQARTDRKFAALPDLAVSSQKAGAQAVFPLLEELLASMNNVLAIVSSSQPEFKTTTETALGEILAPWQPGTPSATGADLASVEVTIGDTKHALQFVREESQWRVQFPAIPEEAELSAARDDLQAAVDRLDDLVEGAAGKSAPEPTAVQDAVTFALSQLRKYLVAG